MHAYSGHMSMPSDPQSWQPIIQPQTNGYYSGSGFGASNMGGIDMLFNGPAAANLDLVS